MKKKALLFLSACILVIITLAGIGVNDHITVLIDRLEKYALHTQQEKVYLHLDKPYYAIGDNIWFKAYVVNTRTAELSDISNTLYVELIDEQDSVRRVNLPLENGVTWGDFKLPDTLNEGNYRIRAYTRWMRNAGAGFFFDKTIKIGNAFSNGVFTTTTYTYTRDNGVNKATAAVLFKDGEGKPISNESIRYAITFPGHDTKKGNAKTDENGNMAITFDVPDNALRGSISATVSLPGGKKAVKTFPLTATSAATDVQFFPEGGYLVEGLPAKIAVKAVGASGKGEPVSGTIVNQAGAEEAAFSTSSLGMSSFFINPKPGASYSAKVKFADGSVKDLPLPKVKKEGHVITVNPADSSKLDVKVFQSAALLKNDGNLTLVGQRNGTVYFVTKLPAGKQVISLNVPTTNLPSGIVQLTLFSAEDLPVCERLVFVNNVQDKIDVQLSGLANAYRTRGKTVLGITAGNKEKPLQGSFSVAVTNTDIVKPEPEYESNIYTSLLLTSDITGYVERPNYYFINTDRAKRGELDNLLLTQGWRKITWEKLDDLSKPLFEAEKGIKISGMVTEKGKPLVKGKISLLSSQGGFFKLDTLTDAKGRFDFGLLAFKDSTKFIIQARTSSGDKKKIDVLLDEIPGQSLTMNKNIADQEANVNAVIYDYIQQSNKFFDEQLTKGMMDKSIAIEAVTVSVDKRTLAPNSANFNGAGNADVVISEKEIQEALTLNSLLFKKIPGYTTRGGTPYVNRYAMMNPITLYIDGNKMPGAAELLNMDHTQFESIEVLLSPSYTTIYRETIVVLITTLKGPSKYNPVEKYAPGLVTHMPPGYSISRSFYSPVYAQANDPKPDLRTTVYWNPNIVTDETGKASFEFYNNDVPGNYRMVIEGMDASGMLARKVIHYSVDQAGMN